MIYNIEPFHFGIEDITAKFPTNFSALEKYIKEEHMLGVMIDNTGFDKEPFYINEIKNWLNKSKFNNCLIINELRLQSISTELIRKLPQKHINSTSTYINIKFPHFKKPILLAKKTKELEIKPSCALLTLSWYLMRLSTSYVKWNEGINSEDKKNEIINECSRKVKNQDLLYDNTIVNHLPKVFEKNEEKVSVLFDNLIWNFKTANSSEHIINHFY